MHIPTYEEILSKSKTDMIAAYGMCHKCGWYPKPFGLIAFNDDGYVCPECGEKILNELS